MDHGICVREQSGPLLGRRDIARQWRRAECGKFFRGGFRTRQAVDLVSARDKFANDRRADRTGAAENKDTHDAGSLFIIARYLTQLSRCSSRAA
jgi:hypothetical protein